VAVIWGMEIMINKNSIEYRETKFGINMAKLCLQNHWKRLGKKHDMSDKEQVAEANWYLDWALSWVDEVK